MEHNLNGATMEGNIETRIRILEEAKIQFLTYGLTKVTMDEIATVS
ncbi:MAG: hypothetical protein V1799_05055 [bacterium]